MGPEILSNVSSFLTSHNNIYFNGRKFFSLFNKLLWRRYLFQEGGSKYKVGPEILSLCF